MRASDADRDRVADVLREAMAEGRLTPEEHADRIDQVYRARTLGELGPITADLPAAGRSHDLVPRPPVPAPYAPQVRSAPPAIAVFSEVKRTGRWTVPATTRAWAVFGAVRIDLTQAVLSQPEVTIRAFSVFGSINVDVPEGMDVQGGGTAVFGVRNMPEETGEHGAGGDPAVPGGAQRTVLHVGGFTLFGDCNVRRKRRRQR